MTPNELEKRIEALDHAIGSTDPNEPGLALRLDRLEREVSMIVTGLKSIGATVKWIVGGGGLTFAATLLYLYKLAQAMSAVES